MGSEMCIRDRFVTGRRTNAEVPSSINFTDPESMHKLVHTIQGCGTLYIPNSEDYFFVTRDFLDWTEIPPLVLGGVVFDNWLVNLANEMEDVLTVDATQTVTCVHQEHPNYSHNPKNPRSEFNLKLAKANGGWSRGHTIHIPFETQWYNDAVIVVQRKVNETTARSASSKKTVDVILPQDPIIKIKFAPSNATNVPSEYKLDHGFEFSINSTGPVSYTHLTLPTIYSV